MIWGGCMGLYRVMQGYILQGIYGVIQGLWV